MSFSEFSTRPWGIAAHSLKEFINLKHVFLFKSEITELNPKNDMRSHVIDNYLNVHFESLFQKVEVK